MIKRTIYLLAVLSIGILFSACGGSQADPAANKAGTNTAANAANESNTAQPVGEAAPTLTPVFKAYCEAVEKKDDAGIRKALSAETLKSFEKDMKEQKIKTLSEYLKDENISTQLCDVRNEVIKGDEATARIFAQPYPKGIDIVFVKEGGEWKLTTRSPVLDMKTGSDANAAAPADKK